MKSKSGPYIKVQYYNTKNKDKDMDLKLTWWRQNPESDEEDYQEIYKDKLSAKELDMGYEPWTEEIHSNLFYQRRVELKDMKLKKSGRYIQKLRKAAIKRAGALLPM